MLEPVFKTVISTRRIRRVGATLGFHLLDAVHEEGRAKLETDLSDPAHNEARR
jgi:hypothetical protein